MTVKATQFRQNLFQILDQCRDSRKPIRIERGDEVYEVVHKPKKMRVEDIPERPWAIVGNINELHLAKTSEWDPDGGFREHDLS